MARLLVAVACALFSYGVVGASVVLAGKGGNGGGKSGSSQGDGGGNGNGNGGKSDSAPGHADGGGSGDQGGGGGDTGGDPGSGSPPPASGGGHDQQPSAPSDPAPDQEPASSEASESSGSGSATGSGSTNSTSAPATASASAPPSPSVRSSHARSRNRASSPSRPSTRRRSGSSPRRLARRAARGAKPSPVRAAEIVSSGSPSAKPRPRGGDDTGGSNSVVPRVVREVIEVVPAPLKWALMALASMLAVVGLVAAVNAVRARRLAHQRSELVEEVGVLQTALLPEVPPRLGPAWVSAAYRPADGPGAGGNFYDAFELPGERVGLLVGEVSSEGRDRLAESMVVRHTLRAHLRAGLEPREVIGLGREEFGADLEGELRMAIVAVYDAAADTLTYASIGDQHPVVVGVDGPPPLRAVASSEGSQPDQTVVRLAPGGRACLFSPGLVEARVDGSEMGREGVGAIMGELGADLTADSLLETVVDRARAVPTDMTACVLEPDREAVAAETAVSVEA